MRVPAGLTDEEALSLAKRRFPLLYDTRGIFDRASSAAVEGIRQLGESASGVGAGTRSLFGDTAGTQRYIDEQAKERAEGAKQPRGIEFQNLIDQYKTEGILPALSNVPAYVTEQILKNAPSMAVPLAAGAATTAYSAPFLGPFAPAAGLAAGIGTYGLQTFGQNIQRQAGTEGRTAETMEPGQALGAAAVGAPLGFLVDRFALGLGKMSTKTATALLEKEIGARSVGKTLAVGAARGLTEVPTEVLEQVLERAQAGLDLTNAEAKAEYLEAAGGALAIGTVGGAGFAYRARGQAKEAVEQREELQKAQERNQARMAAAQEQQQETAKAETYKASPEYAAGLFQELSPLMGRIKEINDILKVGGKDLDPDDRKALQEERKLTGTRITEINKALKEVGAVPPPAVGKKSAKEIAEQLRAQGQVADEQLDLFQQGAGPYSQLEQQPAVEEKPNLREEHRNIKSALNDVGPRLTEAAQTGNVPTYIALQSQFEQLEAALSQIKEAAKAQNVYLEPQQIDNALAALAKAMQSGQSAKTVTALNDKLQALRQQAEPPSMEGTLFDPAKPSPRDQQQQKFNQERKARREQAELEQAAGTVEQRVESAPIESILIGQGRTLEETKKRRKQISQLQKDADNGVLTPELQKLYGVSGLENKSYDLVDAVAADAAVPKIQTRLNELEQQRKTEFPNKTLEQNGVLTKDGLRLVGVEASIQELNNLLAKAKPTGTPAETRLLSAATRAEPKSTYAPAPEAVDPGRARILGDKAETTRRAALADFAEVIDTLRKGDFTDVLPQDLLKEADTLRATYVDSMLLEAAYRRMERNRGEVTQDDAVKAAFAVNTRMQKLIDTAQRPRAPRGAVGLALEKAMEPQSKKVYEAAVVVAKLNEQLKKTGPDVNVKELRAQLNEAQKLFKTEEYKYKSVIKQSEQDAVKRGMTISERSPGESGIFKGVKWKTETASNLFELRKLQKQLADVLQQNEAIERAQKRGAEEIPALAQQRIEQGKTERVEQQAGAIRALKQKKRSPRVSYQAKMLQGQLEGAFISLRTLSTKDTEALLAEIKSKVNDLATSQTEYSKLRNELGRVAYELAYPLRKYQTVKTPFQLKPLSSGTYTQRDTDATVESLRVKLKDIQTNIIQTEKLEKPVSSEALAGMRTLQAQIAKKEAIQEQSKNRITDLRGQADTLANEMARLKTAFEKVENSNARKKLIKKGEFYNKALNKVNAKILALRGETGVGERRGTPAAEAESKVTDMFNQLERREAAIIKVQEIKRNQSPQAKKLIAQAAQLRRNLDNLFDKKLKTQRSDLAILEKEYSLLKDKQLLPQLKQKVNAAKSALIKTVNAANRGFVRVNEILVKAENKQKLYERALAKIQTAKEAKAQDVEKAEARKEAADKVEVTPKVKPRTLFEAKEALQKTGTVETYEVIDVERVKKLPEGTELAGIEEKRKNLSKKIRALGVELDLEPRDALRAKPDELDLSTERDRNINNIRLGLLAEYEELGGQLVMPIRTRVDTKVTTKDSKQQLTLDTASRVIPRQYGIANFDVKQVREALKNKSIPKAKRTELELKRKNLNQRIMDLERLAKRFDVDLSLLAEPEAGLGMLGTAQAVAVNEGLAAAARRPPMRDPYLRTGSPEQKQAREDTRQKNAEARQRAKLIQETELSKTELSRLNYDPRGVNTKDSGVDTNEAAAVATRVKNALPKGINFTYAATTANLPAEVREAMAAQGHQTIKGAVLPDGRVFVVGEAHKNIADLQDTIAHELIGHYGVDTILGKDGVQALTDKLFAKGNDYVAQVATGLGVFDDVSAALNAIENVASEEQAALKTALVREMIAHAAEGRRVAPKFVEKVKGFLKDIIAAVRGWFRNTGLSEAAKQDTKAIQALIKDAERALAGSRLGAYVSPTGEAAFRAKMPAGFEAIQDFADAVIAKPKGLLGTIKSRSGKQNRLAATVSFVDRLAAIEEVADRAIKAGNGNEAMQMMYFLQKQLDMLSMASASAYNGALELVEEKGEFRIQANNGASLRTTDRALKPLLKMGFNAAQVETMFTSYLASLRGAQEGYEKLNFNPEVIKMAKEIVSLLKTKPEVKAILDNARDEYNEYNKGQVRFLEKTGAITPELAADLLKKNDYIPYYRDVGGVLSMFIGSGTTVKLGDLKNQPHLQKLVGGDDKILSYFESSMQNTLLLTDLSLRNLATKNTAHAFHTFGLLESHKGRDGKDYFIRPGDGPANVNVLRFKDKGVEKHVVVKTEDTPYEYIPTELLVKGMEGTALVMPTAVKLLSLPAQVVRKGITLNPLYPYYQLVKDSMAMGATRGVSFSNTINLLKGINQYINGDALIKELQAKGVISEREMFTGTIDDVAKIRNRVLTGESKWSKFVAAQEARNVRADGAVRAMLYSEYLKKGLSARDAEYMAIKAMPYNRRGLDSGMRYLSQMVPFFNAQIVGLYSLYQSIRGQGPMAGKLQIKKKLYTAGMGMAVSTLVYAALVAGEDWYENMPLETRLRNWLIKLPGMEEPVAIPIPFEFGIIFKAFFEATYMGMFNSSPEGKKILEAFTSVALGAIPLPAPALIKPAVELWANKVSFTGNPIEGARELGVEAAERFRDTTSEFAKSLGRSTGLVGVSPLQIDHLIRGYTGTVGPAVIALLDVFTGPANPAAGVKPDTPISKLPLLSQIFKSADGGAIIDLAVDTLRKAEQISKTHQKLIDDGRHKEADEYLEKNQANIMRGDLAGKLRQRLGEYAKVERNIKARPASEMSSSEKRKALEDLRQSKIQESKNYMQAFRIGA